MQCPRVWSAPKGDTGSKELWEIAPHKVQIKQYGGRQAAEEKLNLLCMIASKVSSRITTCCPLRHLLRPLVQKKVLCPLTRFLLLGIRKAARVWFTLVYINIYIYYIFFFYYIYLYLCECYEVKLSWVRLIAQCRRWEDNGKLSPRERWPVMAHGEDEDEIGWAWTSIKTSKACI